MKKTFSWLSAHGEMASRRIPLPILYDEVVKATALDLSALRYSVLALGDTSYDLFCQCGKDFDNAFEKHGAQRIQDRIDCDVDYEDECKRWLRGVLENLRPEVQAV